jgi:hypothetical protein
MLGALISRLVQHVPGNAYDHLFTPFAPDGAPAHVLTRIYNQYADALEDEPVPAQHRHFRALIQDILAADPGALARLEGARLRRVSSAYVTCFERHEPFQFQLALWRGEPDFREALIEARENVIADLVADADAEKARRIHYSRWDECLAAPIDLLGPTLLDSIKRMGPDDWHEIVLRWNWDDGVAELNWITSQRACDRATAVHALCRGDPAAVATHTTTRHGGFVRAVASRLENGFYPNAEFDLGMRLRERAHFERDLAIAAATGASPWQFPADLLLHPGAREHRPKYTLIDGQLRYHYEYWLARVADR